MPRRECGPEAEQSRAAGCSWEAGGQIYCCSRARELACLTARRPQRTRQDHCHRILRTFTLFKDKCIVNFVSPSTGCACRFTPSAAKRWPHLRPLQDTLQMKSNVFLNGAELLNPALCRCALGLQIVM